MNGRKATSTTITHEHVERAAADGQKAFERFCERRKQQRREKFEAWIVREYIARFDNPTSEQARELDAECREYNLKRLEGSEDYLELDTQIRWLAWNAALDSIEIEAAGLKVKP